MAGALDSVRKLLLVWQTDARVVAVLDLAEPIHKVFDGRQIFVINVSCLVGTEGAAAFSERMLLVGGKNNFSHNNLAVSE